MQADGPVQTGGVDPGLAALIAAILSGSVGAYGYSQESRNTMDVAREQLDTQVKQQLRAAQDQAKAAVNLSNEATKRTSDYEDLKKELEDLRARCSALETKAEYLSKSSAIFKNASADALNAAIPRVLQKLSAKYAWVDSEGERTPRLKKALAYPGSYTGRLARMSLYDFYTKQVVPAIEKDTKPPKGGRGKRRYRRSIRGGDMAAELNALEQQQGDVSVGEQGSATSYSIPSYEEFAELYSRSIEEATAAMPTFKKKMDDQLQSYKKGLAEKGLEKKNAAAEKGLEKKNAAAKKAAMTLIGKLESAVKDAEAALAIPVPEEQKEALRSVYDALEEKVKKARDLVGMVQPDSVPRGPAWPQSFNTGFGWHDSFLQGGATTLREVNTEDDWSEVNKDNQATGLLDELKSATKSYIDAVKLAKESSNRTPGEKFLNSVEPVTSEADLRDSELKSIEDTIANRLREAEVDKSFEGMTKIERLKSAARTASQARERVKTARNKFKDTVTQYERKVKEARKTLRAFRKSPEDVEAANTTLRLPPTEAQSEVSSVLDEVANVKLGLDDFLEGKTAAPVKPYESNEGALLSDLLTRKRMAKESAKADVLAEELAPLARDTVIRRTSTTTSNPTSVKGGKARKRTLKKRRGGK